MRTLERNTKVIQCPHVALGRHDALLYVAPHEKAGSWECPYGYADVCKHTNREVQRIENGYLYGGEWHEYSYLAYVCESCGVVIDGEYPAEEEHVWQNE